MSLPEPYYDRDGITIYHAPCEDVMPHISGVDAVVTDPPYGVAFDTDFTRFTGGVAAERSRHAAVHDDDRPFEPETILTLGVTTVLFGANAFSNRLPCGSWLVWDKRSTQGAKNVMSDAEVAWFSKGHGVYIFSHTWDGFNRASERQTAYHPTQKPVALMQWVINRCTKPGDLVLDPYMGSGPIAKACHMTGRRYIGCEIEEQYVIRAVERLQQQVLPLGEVA